MENKIYFFKTGIMYAVVLGITLYHTVVLLFWIFLNQFELETKLTLNEEEYSNCKFPKTEIFGSVKIYI